MEFTIQHVAGGESAELVARQAMQRHGLALHMALLEWLRAHPDPLDPVVIIAAGDGQPGLCEIGPRSELLSYSRSYLRQTHNSPLQNVIDALSRMSPVPLGVVDVIVSTPRMVALLRATSTPEGVS